MAGDIVTKVDIEMSITSLVQLMLDLSCSEPMYVHARTAKLILVYSVCNMAYITENFLGGAR
jgi:hypothetical protein